MQNLLTELTKTLETDARLVIDGKLAKNKIIELGLALDEPLIKLLLKNDAIKKHFFREMERILVFDKIEFQKSIEKVLSWKKGLWTSLGPGYKKHRW
jgi:adenine-specific DNA-methyltransferase